MLITDHSPLVNQLLSDKSVPVVAVAQIQRFAPTLAAYYTLKYRKGSLNANADACSTLPLNTKHADPPVLTMSVLLLTQLNNTTVMRHPIATKIDKLPDRRKLKSYILKRFPKKIEKNLHLFVRVKDELSFKDDIISRGSCAFIPPIFKKLILDEFHSSL